MQRKYILQEQLKLIKKELGLEVIKRDRGGDVIREREGGQEVFYLLCVTIER